MAGFVFVAIFLAFLVTYAVVALVSDGKRAALRGRPLPVSQPAGLTTVKASLERAVEISRDAIRTLDASDFKVIDGVGVIGWKGSIFTNVPKWAPYELGVLIHPVGSEHVQLISYARPRFSSAFLGGRQSLELGAALAREVSRRAAAE